MNYELVKVRTSPELNKYIMLPWSIYKGDKNWVPPLIKDLKHTLDTSKNVALRSKPHEKFLLYKDGNPCGRIMAGIDAVMNLKKGTNSGYLGMFECINDHEAAKLLFDAAITWLKSQEIDFVRGPFSATGTDGDENKGLLIEGFESPPVLMNSYNPSYYSDLFEKYGFVKDYDLYAYYISKENSFLKDPTKTIEYAKKKYKFRVEPINFKNIDKEVHDLKKIMDAAIPDEWPDLVPPSIEEVYEMAHRLKPIADENLIMIARSNDTPIGFGVALPDFNQVLIHMNGRINPISLLKYLWYKRKITCARLFVMFVVPEFRKKGVSHAIYYTTFVNSMNKGHIYGEGSTIGETNIKMRNDIENFGGKKYKTYRVYGMSL